MPIPQARHLMLAIKHKKFPGHTIINHQSNHSTFILQCARASCDSSSALGCCTPLPSQSKGTWGWLTQAKISGSPVHHISEVLNKAKKEHNWAPRNGCLQPVRARNRFFNKDSGRRRI